MIIIQLTGRLGNQMFQYAFGKALSIAYNTECRVDLLEVSQYELPIVFAGNFIEATNEQIEYCKNKEQRANILFRLYRKICKKESNFHRKYWVIENKLLFDNKNFRIKKDCFLQGIFQSEKYFIEYALDIQKIFTFKNPPNNYYTGIIEQISNSNSISIHFRRTDYVTDDTIKKTHGPCEIAYYLEAIQVMRTKVENPKFFFISDDIQWVKSQFSESNDYIFVENNMGENYEDMRVMTKCKHNIIANSSFSWWGAWLNTNKGKIVIAPQQWFADEKLQQQTYDIIPETWIRI